jgi:hypothetical protein
MKRQPQTESAEEAEVIALQSLSFISADPARIERFLDLSGLNFEAIRAGAADPSFLGGVLDYLLADQSLLLIFASGHGLKPERIMALRRKLPGAVLDF